jgi:protein-serine/threonine kinase
MTQLFSGHTSLSKDDKEKQRVFSGIPLPNNRPVSNNQVAQKIKSFFRINSNDTKQQDRALSHRSSDNSNLAKPEKQHSFRNSRFLSHIGRNRSTTVASEGNILEDVTISPTANANPYFAHQGPPALRHHNEGSVPPSPPDSPPLSGSEKKIGGKDKLGTKEDLARKLRRVASAPNSHGLFAKGRDKDRPSTAEMRKKSLNTQHSTNSALNLPEQSEGTSHTVPVFDGLPEPGVIKDPVAFRRTYSSNSIKVRSVEVSPASFDKIKLIGKGDVGKVYLVREKKSSRLYAMKGKFFFFKPQCSQSYTKNCSTRQERND